MADRKQFQNVTPPNPELLRLLEESRRTPVSEEVLHAQRISFAYGNAPVSNKLITKESVLAASKSIKLLP